MTRFVSDPRPASSIDEPHEPSAAHIERLLQAAASAEAFRHRLVLLNAEAQHRLALHRSYFNRDQPRVPAGYPDGGQWTSEGGIKDGSEPQSMSDVSPDNDWKPGAQYASNRGRPSVPARKWAEPGLDGVERTPASAAAPGTHPDSSAPPAVPGRGPRRDFAQAEPFGGFSSPRPSESLTNQVEYAECITSRSSTSSEMKGGNYEFCTYGRLVPMKTDPNTGEPTALLIMAGPNGNEVYGRDRLTGAWGRWTLGPGQRMTATIGEDGQFNMNIQ
jgi:hypothetical protein